MKLFVLLSIVSSLVALAVGCVRGVRLSIIAHELNHAFGYAMTSIIAITLAIMLVLANA